MRPAGCAGALGVGGHEGDSAPSGARAGGRRAAFSAAGTRVPAVTVSIVLTEQALGADDAARILALHDPPAQLQVLVPDDTERSLLADVLAHLSLLELRGALGAVREDDDDRRAAAGEALAASLDALRSQGASVEGLVVTGDPLAAVQDAVQAAVGRGEPDAGTGDVVSR